MASQINVLVLIGRHGLGRGISASLMGGCIFVCNNIVTLSKNICNKHTPQWVIIIKILGFSNGPSWQISLSWLVNMYIFTKR
jgi:hypothetical protein